MGNGKVSNGDTVSSNAWFSKEAGLLGTALVLLAMASAVTLGCVARSGSYVAPVLVLWEAFQLIFLVVLVLDSIANAN